MASWARRSLAAATSFMARVIFCVDLTDAIRIRTALSEGIGLFSAQAFTSGANCLPNSASTLRIWATRLSHSLPLFPLACSSFQSAGCLESMKE